MDQQDNSELNNTLRCAALIKLVESGIIQQEENGTVNTEDFEVFWSRFEKDINTAFANEIQSSRPSIKRFYDNMLDLYATKGDVDSTLNGSGISVGWQKAILAFLVFLAILRVVLAIFRFF